MEVEKLVCIDETWTSTSMTRRYGRAPRGRRCLDSAPHGHGETTTFVGALRRRRLTAPMVTDGPMDGEMFLAYGRQCLCPRLQPGDTVILDNLSSHKVAGVAEAITATGAIVLFLPPYSPDLNPIEKFFPNSRRGSAKPRNAISMLSGRKSGSCSIRSPQANAQTTSPLADMYALRSKAL
jgi:transposase